MSPTAKFAAGAVLVAVVLGMIGVPWWVVLLVVVAVPVGAYLMLDPSQRRRLRNVSRKQIGR
jgi:membrane protein implicated in regulation of membrane protease activity